MRKPLLTLKNIFPFFIVISLLSCKQTEYSDTQTERLRALIIDGQNNHRVWPKATYMMKQYLEETGLFEVDIYRSQYTWRGEEFIGQFSATNNLEYIATEEPKADPNFAPPFSNYDLVVSNFGWRAEPWPASTQKAFEDYMKNGGGFVSVHGANNSFPDWPAYNEMTGLGGWGERDESNGPWLYFDETGELIRDHSAGVGGGHGKQHEFIIETRNTEHPIMKGIPQKWMHAKDELYNRLRGPAKHLTILASAFDDKEINGFGRNEPILMTINYHQGRIFHSTLGHSEEGVSCVGFITTFQRGAEWAATGKVTIPIPKDFPSDTESSSRAFTK